MSQNQAVHPEITSLIRRRDEIYQMLLERQYAFALEAMDLLICELKTKDQKQELLNEIRKHRTSIQNMPGAVWHDGFIHRLNFTRFNKAAYIQLYQRMCKILWDGGYLIMDNYTAFFDPALGRKSGEQYEKRRD